MINLQLITRSALDTWAIGIEPRLSALSQPFSLIRISLVGVAVSDDQDTIGPWPSASTIPVVLQIFLFGVNIEQLN